MARDDCHHALLGMPNGIPVWCAGALFAAMLSGPTFPNVLPLAVIAYSAVIHSNRPEKLILIPHFDATISIRLSAWRLAGLYGATMNRLPRGSPIVSVDDVINYQSVCESSVREIGH